MNLIAGIARVHHGESADEAELHALRAEVHVEVDDDAKLAKVEPGGVLLGGWLATTGRRLFRWRSRGVV